MYASRTADRDKTYLQALRELLLLLVDYTKTEVYLVCLFEARIHAHDLRKSFFGVFEGTISIV